MTDTSTMKNLRFPLPDEAVASQHSIPALLRQASRIATEAGLSIAPKMFGEMAEHWDDPVATADQRERDLFYVQVTVTRPDGPWTAQRDLPTFVLDGALLGIIGGFNDPHEEVASIVRDLLMVDLHAEEGWQYSAAIRQGGSPVVEIHDLVGRRITRTIEATD